MGLFDSLKKCQCKVCYKEMTVKEAIRKKNWIDTYLCPVCDDFLERNYIYVPLSKDYLPLFQKDMAARIKKYVDIFQPTMHYGSIHIDPQNGLFACCDEYIPGKNAVYGFHEYEMVWEFKVSEFKKIKKQYKAIGHYELWFTEVDWGHKGDHGRGYSIMDVPITEEFMTGVDFYGEAGTSNDYNFYKFHLDYVDDINEVIHQYLRNADNIRFEIQEEEREDPDQSFSPCTWLLFNGKPWERTARNYAEAYSFANLRYNRTSKDPKEVLACLRLDRAFACSLARSKDNTDMEYKREWVDVYFDIVKEFWDNYEPTGKPLLFTLNVDEMNAEFRRRIGR